MRFSSIAIIFQSANIFLTALAVYTTGHISEESKIFRCRQRDITERDFASTQRKEITHVANDKISWSWTSQLSDLMTDSRNQNVVLFGKKSEVSKFYILERLTTSGTSNGYNHTYEYIIMVDEHDRACGAIMRVLTRASYDSSNLPDQNISLCSIVY
ncbi:unnamed protein product [Blumeria hordei]|uniref:Uncharacterized protein n=2 Tax=Blumeria hordei TaxID=2867405 RepID=A0A383V0F7_BLUHO|nr:CSEP0171 putative effector protein [Blumeria hordei DH14]SZF05140.1 unnamed protein product [Blumeria hordei]